MIKIFRQPSGFPATKLGTDSRRKEKPLTPAASRPISSELVQRA
jgi:hypothetical protein